MSKVYCFILLMLVATGISAQSLFPETIATSGGSFSETGLTVDYVLGELTTGWITLENKSIAPGVLQPYPAAEQETGFSIFPNPVIENTLTVQTSQPVAQIFIIDLSGKEQKRFDPITPLISTVSLADLAGSVYVVRVRFAGGKTVSKRIIKL